MASERVQRQINRLLDEAEEAVTGRDWIRVRDCAQDVLALDPDNADAGAFAAAAERTLGGETLSAAVPDEVPSPVPSQALPTSFKEGRYMVKEFLGEGATKKVYLVHDTLLDRDLALIKSEGLDQVGRQRILREARTMGGLGDHPNIVQLYDLGDESGQPYMVLPVMSGGDIDGLMKSASNHRLALEVAIDITVDVCRGLVFAHSKGVVHRDLKPGNVWLTSDGTAKIGDFGLAIAMGHTRLTKEDKVMGTPWYMPPEQAMGGEVSVRSDLYSLGCMLYEMVTGRPPFLGDDSVAIIGQHINTPPVALTWHNASCPRLLEALILRLLAKDPAQRPASAADVLTALESIGPAPNVEAPAPEADRANALDSLAGGVFVGRQHEMGELKATLEDALSGRGRMVSLAGDPGIGKTRTSQELATYAGLRGAQVLWGRCYEEQGVPPYWPWVQIVRSYVREREADQLRSEMGSGARDIAEIVPEVSQRIPDLPPAPALGDPEQARFRLFDSVTSFLKSASRKQPLVVVLDDMHWADMPSLLLLQFIARELEGARLLIVGTCREAGLSRQHPLVECHAELTRQGLCQRVFLRGLSQEDVGRFIEVTSGLTPPGSLVSAVYAQTEGNPLFVTEVVRLLVQERELTPERVGKRESWSVKIPEGVREVIGRRLNRLSKRCNQTLAIASVIGREFSMDQLARLVDDLSDDRLLAVLEEAISARVIEELPTAVGRYQFTHALTQNTLAEELSIARRARLHARIAEALEDLYGSDLEVHAAEIARHFVEAQTVAGTDKLVRYSALAGEQALGSYAHEEAMAHFQRALAAKEGRPMDVETAAMLFGLGRAQAVTLEQHDRAEALASLGRAFDHYAETGDVSNAVAIAEYPLILGFGDRGMAQIIDRALALVPPDSPEAGRLLCQYGLSLYLETAEYDVAQEPFDRALAISQREKDEALELRVLSNSAHVDWDALQYKDSLEKNLRAIELARRVDDLHAETSAYMYATASLLSLGDVDGSISSIADGLDAAGRLRDRGMLAGALQIAQAASHGKGDWGAAREYCDRGLDLEPSNPFSLGHRALLEF